MVKNLSAVQEAWVWSLGWEDPLEEGMVTHSSILNLENTNGYSPWRPKESDTTKRLSTSQHIIVDVAITGLP